MKFGFEALGSQLQALPNIELHDVIPDSIKGRNMTMRKLALSTTVAAVTLLIGTNADAQNLKSQIAGAYSLVSIYDELADGKKNDTWGPGVEGSAIYTASGFFSVQILSADRKNTSAQGPRDPIGPIVTYYGTYTIDDASKVMTYHIKKSSFPGWNGFERKVTIAGITGNELELAAPVKGDPKMGDFVAKSKWKREGSP